MIPRDILDRLIETEHRGGPLCVDDCQKYSRISPGKEGELISQTSTHTNVVFGGVETKSELNDNKQCDL